MVYCGKASQGCQSCRTRRIKCDRVQPQCTQCVRIRKQCPGYRDQLSLMFRDESTKVMQKAHAQWGVTESSELGESSGASPTSASPSSTRSRSIASDAASPSSASVITTKRRRKSPEENRLAREICATPVEKAVHFYIQQYIIGLPDEPKAGRELQGARWIHSRQTRDIMAAVGLAGMSNLSGDNETNTLAKQHYGLALQNIASSMRNMEGIDLDIVLRVVVMMAMYEVTRGRDEPNSPARTHVMGGAAILSSFLSLRRAPAEGPRGLLQMCFSMVAAKQGSFQYSSPEPNVLFPTYAEPECDGAFPETLFDWISTGETMVSDTDRPSAELIKIVVRFVQLAALARSQPHLDGRPRTTHTIREALAIDEELEAWEGRQKGIWAVTEERVGDYFPPEAVFDGCYHVYDNTYIARVWNHYRWPRILVNQMLLESADKFLISSALLITAEQRRRSRECIRRLARDTLVSVPTHYRHPSLQPAHWERFDKTKFGASVGVAGIPTLLFEVKVAGCAPGVSEPYRAWALDMLDTVYRRTGMFQANVLAGFLRRMVPSRSSSPSSVSSGSSPGRHAGGEHVDPGITWVKNEVLDAADAYY